MKLAELQALFQSAILAGDETDAQLIEEILPKADESRETLLGVYVNAYSLRLTEYLDEDYPALRAYLGEKEFRALVKAYIAANPSKFRNARWFSNPMPEFMQESAKWRAKRRAIGIAQFERALTDAFDAADASAASLEALASFPPEEWPELAFSFHPSLHLLQVAKGTLDAYVAATAEDEETRKRLAQIRATACEGTEAAAVWRAEGDLSYRGLEDDERLALNEAIAGKSFGEICQLVAFQDESQPAVERLAQFLVNWFSEGLVAGVAKATCD